jgi:hypothetical protein
MVNGAADKSFESKSTCVAGAPGVAADDCPKLESRGNFGWNDAEDGKDEVA